jgi:GDP-L-fucose synthase
LGKSPEERLLVDEASKIYIAGDTGMVGSAILRNLKSKGYCNFIFTPYPEYDLTNQKTVEDFFEKEKPDYVIDAAAKVGGIFANNSYRAQFIYENMMIQNNLIHSAHVSGVKKLLFLGSSCIYPRDCVQPIKEEYLLTGLLESTNEPYAIAKISGIKMCENYFRQYDSNFISVMPTNLYGPGDNYDLNSSHVIPALIRKFHDAKESQSPKVEIWGTGNPKREFLYVEDMADACIHLLENLDAAELYASGITHINIGSGVDLSIKELALTVREVVGFDGALKFDATKPDGTPRKLLDVSRLEKLGWKYQTELKAGLTEAYKSFRKLKLD